MNKILLRGIVLVFSILPVFAQAENVRFIDITSTWGGLGNAGRTLVKIQRKGNRFESAGKKVDGKLILNLLETVMAADVEHPNPASLGINSDWLAINSRRAIQGYGARDFSNWAPNQQKLYISKYQDFSFVSKLIPQILRGGWTDDYPNIAVVIQFDEGRTITLKSDNQPTLMLPWSKREGSNESKTYNADISRGVAALLPNNAANKRRLSGESLATDIAKAVMTAIDAEWERLNVLNKVPSLMADLENQFEVTSPEINGLHGLDFGFPWTGGGANAYNFEALLRPKLAKDRLLFRLILPYENREVKNVDLFKSELTTYQRSVLDIPWLQEFIRTGKPPVWLRFVKNRSFSQKAFDAFAADMIRLNKQELVDKVEPYKEKAVLLSLGGGLDYYQSYWIVLPSKTVIIWRDNYNIFLSRWKQERFVHSECSESRSGGPACVGAEVSPAGDVIKY